MASFQLDGLPTHRSHGHQPSSTSLSQPDQVGPLSRTFFNALSISFPPGEKFFADSVMLLFERAPAHLKQDILLFTKQETNHARQHSAYNQRLTALGYDLSALEHSVRLRLTAGRFLPIERRLGMTAAMEHFTAILARLLLVSPRWLKGAEPEMQALWTWHAREEIEHKAVAYDAFMHAAASLTPYRRWLLRAGLMRLATKIFVAGLMSSMVELLVQEGCRRNTARQRVLQYLFAWPGPLRQVALPYAAYFIPAFHPWVRKDDLRFLPHGTRFSTTPAGPAQTGVTKSKWRFR